MPQPCVQGMVKELIKRFSQHLSKQYHANIILRSKPTTLDNESKRAWGFDATAFCKRSIEKKTEQANEMTTELLIHMILKQLMIRPM
jgi:hypothetical protein